MERIAAFGYICAAGQLSIFEDEAISPSLVVRRRQKGLDDINADSAFNL